MLERTPALLDRIDAAAEQLAKGVEHPERLGTRGPGLLLDAILKATYEIREECIAVLEREES